MHLLSCEHPIRVYNKYSKEYVWTSCGKCPTCKKARASRWTARLEEERKQHPYCMFVTLTYSNEYLPLYSFYETKVDKLFGTKIIYENGSYKRVDDFDKCISLKDLEFDTLADKEYFWKRVVLDGIPFADVSDLQKFHKRLNKLFYEKFEERSTFRYFAVSEYGSTTIRPHFHCIYFIDSKQVAESFREAVVSCWSFGRVDTQFVESNACSYVSKYLNQLFSLPSFYKDNRLRPFFVCSKRPPLGSFNEFTKNDEEIFNKCLTQRIVRDTENPNKVRFVPQLKCVENRLFPKLPFYSQLPAFIRVELYRCASRYTPWLSLSSFKEFLITCKNTLYLNPHHHVFTAADKYLCVIAQRFSERGIEALRRLYYISKRVMSYAQKFGVSIVEYVNRIQEYYDKKELQLLSEFYRFQQDYNADGLHTEELVYCYPEYVFKNVGSDYVVSLESCQDYKLMCNDSAMWNQENTKTHFKNAYFERLGNENNPLYKLLNCFYYAKKRNEAIETKG